MPKLWLRHEVIEHGILHFASKNNESITRENVHLAIQRMREEHLTMAKFTSWQVVAREVFHWNTVESQIFWEFLIASSPDDKTSHEDKTSSTEHMQLQTVPLNSLALYLYMHITNQNQHYKTKEAVESFNAIWFEDEYVRESSPKSPGSSSSSSIQNIRLRDRCLEDAHYLSFTKENLEDIFTLLFSEYSLLSDDDIDSLGFLFTGGNDFVSHAYRLSSLYPLWRGNEEKSASKESVQKLISWFKIKLTVNEVIHPPIGASRTRSISEDVLENDLLEGAENLLNPFVIQGIVKSTFLKSPPSICSNRRDVIICCCHDADIYLPLNFRYLSLVGCTNCSVVVGTVQKIATIDRCEDLRLTLVCSRLRISNCLDSTFFVFTTTNPVLTGDNRGIHLAPYNSYYPKLEEDLIKNGFIISEDSGKWKQFLNIEVEDTNRSNSESEAVSILSPNSFHEICVPIQMDGKTIQNPFPLPEEYQKLIKERLARIEYLRNELNSEQLSLQVRKHLDMAVQANFKDWLIATGNLRQILDLSELSKSSIKSEQQMGT